VSDFTVLAGASRTLRTLLEVRMEQPVPVTIAPPDVTVDGTSGRRLNLFLFQVTENGQMKNDDLQGAGHPADYGYPPLCLDLHYLLTAHGATETGPDADLQAQLILGDAMRVLHEHPVLVEGLDASLAGAAIHLKLMLQRASIEELSKIWTALPDTAFRRSVVYKLSLVQIESRRLRRPSAPVETRRIHTTLSQRPQVTSVYRTPAPGDPTGDPRVEVFGEITIEGLNFSAVTTLVSLGSLAPVVVAPVSDRIIRITVPDDPGLKAGAQPVEVTTVRATEIVEGALGHGTEATGENVQTSNQGVFMLAPTLTSTSPASGTSAGLLTVVGKRLFDPEGRSLVIVGDVAIPIETPGLGDPWAAPTETQVEVPLSALAAPIPPIPAGLHPVRVQANGALSITEKTFDLT
jgi:hypothetical protein